MTKSIKKFAINTFSSRRTEPTFITIWRIIISFIAGITLASYLGWKVYELTQNKSSLSFKKDTNNPIPAPFAFFGSPHSFTVDCMIHHNAHDDATPDSDCTQHVKVNNNYYPLYVMIFDASNINFADDRGNAIIAAIVMRIDINMDPTTYAGDDAILFVGLYDPDTESQLQVASKKQTAKGVNNIESTIGDNGYYLARNQSYTLFYERKITNLLNHDATDVLFGKAKSNPIPVPLLSSNLLLVSNPSRDYPGYTNIHILPSSYEVITVTEESDASVIDIISAVGGMFTSVTAIYAILFGTIRLGPWGLCQNLPGIRRKVRTRLYNSLSSNIPFLDPVFSKGLSSDEKFAAVEQRFLSLELFLKDYVVQLDGIIKSNASERDLESSTEKHVDIPEN